MIGGGDAGVTITGGGEPHTGGKNALAAGAQTVNGTVVSVTVTAGSNFFSFFKFFRNRLRRTMTAPFSLRAHFPGRPHFVRLVMVTSAPAPAPLEHFPLRAPLPRVRVNRR
jgi:hypothetical protein